MLANKLTEPLDRPARIQIDVDGDPVYFNGQIGWVPLTVVKNYLLRCCHTEVEMTLVEETQNKATYKVHFIDQSYLNKGQVVEMPVQIELKYKR